MVEEFATFGGKPQDAVVFNSAFQIAFDKKKVEAKDDLSAALETIAALK